MKRFVLFAVFLGLLCCYGCGHGGHHGAPHCQYLCCEVQEDNTVLFTFSLPLGYYGILYQDGFTTAQYIVIANGTINAGVFEPGDYEFCIELISDPGFVWNEGFSSGLLEGVTECCALTVLPLSSPPPPPPPPPFPPGDDNRPKLTCNVNHDGGAVFCINLREYGQQVCLFINGEQNQVITENVVLTDLPLGSGEYTVQLRNCETSEVLAECSFAIPGDNGDDDGDDDDDDDDGDDRHNDHRHKYMVCHNGNTLIVDKHALKAHLAHGDTRGPCNRCRKGHEHNND